MRARSTVRIAGSLLVLAGCEAPADARPKDSDSGAPDSGAVDSADSGDSGDTGCGQSPDTADTTDHGTPVGLCADGGWGGFSGPDTVIHVASSGNDAATGNWWDPVASIDAALALMACDTRTGILVGPGSFAAHADLPSFTTLSGCGTDETTLVGDESDPDFLLEVDGTTGVTIENLSTSGGRRPLTFRGGEATLSSVSVNDPVRTGILGFGGPQLTFTDVWVLNPVADPEEPTGSAAYGISLEGADGTDEGRANVSMEGGGIVAATTAGLIADSTVLSMSTVEISGTLPGVDALGVATYGRGVNVQAWSSATITSCTVSDNFDAGIFASGAQKLTVTDTTVSGVTGSAVSATDATTTGDGIVAIRGDGAYDVSKYTLSVSGGSIDLADRAAVLAEDVTVDEMQPGSIGTTGTGAVYQGAETTGAAITAGDMAPVATDLGLNRTSLAADPGK